MLLELRDDEALTFLCIEISDVDYAVSDEPSQPTQRQSSPHHTARIETTQMKHQVGVIGLLVYGRFIQL